LSAHGGVNINDAAIIAAWHRSLNISDCGIAVMRVYNNALLRA